MEKIQRTLNGNKLSDNSKGIFLIFYGNYPSFSTGDVLHKEVKHTNTEVDITQETCDSSLG